MRLVVAILPVWLAACGATSTEPTQLCSSQRLEGDLLAERELPTRALTGAITPRRPPIFRAGDTDGDGTSELLVTTDHGVAVLDRHDGGFRERASPLLADQLDVDELVVADVDGDARDDVVILALSTFTTGVLSSGRTVGGLWRGDTLDTFDYDADGVLDLAVGEDESLAFYALDTAEPRVLGRVALAARVDSVVFGDWNGDDRPDLAARLLGETRVQVVVADPTASGSRVIALQIAVSDVIDVASVRTPAGDRLVVARSTLGGQLVLGLWGPSPSDRRMLHRVSETTLDLGRADDIASADLDGDGTDELLVAAVSTFVLSVRDGSSFAATGTLKGRPDHFSPPLDVDGNARDEVVTTGDFATPTSFTIAELEGPLPSPVCTFAHGP